MDSHDNQISGYDSNLAHIASVHTHLDEIYKR